MAEDRDIYVIRKSESGDHYLVPIQHADQFYNDELEGNAFDYAQYIDLYDLQIYDYEV